MALPGPVEHLIALWSKFPGIGAKTARRLVFFMLQQRREWVQEMAQSLLLLHEKVGACSECGSLTDIDPCHVCRNELRDRKMLCVVESQEDCVAMEQSGVYNGLYHVLGGRFSPLDDEVIPPASLKKLEQRVQELGSEEIVLAMNPRIEGDLTAYAVNEVLKDSSVRITRLSYGLPVGGSIGFADRVTLHVALESRKELDLGD